MSSLCEKCCANEAVGPMKHIPYGPNAWIDLDRYLWLCVECVQNIGDEVRKQVEEVRSYIAHGISGVIKESHRENGVLVIDRMDFTSVSILGSGEPEEGEPNV